MMLQGVQAERSLRVPAPQRLGGSVKNDGPDRQGGADRPQVTDVIGLDRQHATDLAVRVPQLWRHAPPR